ncbi:hypothetical protein INR49_031949 [Caranx melampygus]|nr:hypothetical protein INR49_031949 [Caranx melampygus]
MTVRSQSASPCFFLTLLLLRPSRVDLRCGPASSTLPACVCERVTLGYVIRTLTHCKLRDLLSSVP